MIWLAKNWKLVALGLACVALVWTGIKLYRTGAAHATTEHQLDIQRKVNASLMVQMATQKAALEAHQSRSIADAQRLTELTKRNTGLNEYVETLGNAECLSTDDVERVRDLWK